MEDLLTNPVFWICVTFASELVGISPLKENSLIQLAFRFLGMLKVTKKL
jgi:hypothetical protein